MIKEVKLWYIRTFKIISTEQAINLGLKFHRNIYGDEINALNCRSLWIDDVPHFYRVEELK